MQKKKIQGLLTGKHYTLFQQQKIWKLVVKQGLSALHILELEACRGFLSRQITPQGLEFTYMD